MGVQEIVVDEHLVPRRDEIGLQIIRGFEITVHAEETRQVAINRVMEGDGIERVLPLIPHEILALLSGQVRGGDERC